MPKYHKKKRHSVFSAPVKPQKKSVQKSKRRDDENIKMSPSGEKSTRIAPPPSVRVVRGRKIERQKKLRTGLIVAAILLIALVIVHSILPAGIFMTVANRLRLIGSGSYPIDYSGNTVKSVIEQSGFYYVLTDECTECYSNSGKKLFSYSHGLENPIIKASAGGALVLDQGGKEAFLFDTSGLKHSIETKKEIITAAISDSGKFAVATKSDQYSAEIKVYSKNAQRILYEWYSAEDLVTGIVLNSKGNRIAIATINMNLGQYDSKIKVLNFDSATPEYNMDLKGQLIYGLSDSKRSFAVVTQNGIQFVRWSNYKLFEYKNDYNIAFFREGKSGFVAVFNRENDKTDNAVATFNNRGKLKAEFKFKGIISDIRISSGHIYCISDSNVCYLSSKGEIITSCEGEFSSGLLVPVNTGVAIVAGNNKLDKIHLE